LDDLSGRVDGLSLEVRELRAETTSRFDAFQRTMVQVAVTMTAAFFAGFAGLAALIAA
jgi:hypothetical protein